MSVFYRCPLCRAAMTQSEKSLVCAEGHNFDISADGYVNFAAFLRHNAQRSGDAPDACAARHAFLEEGLYDRLADAVASVLASLDESLPPLVIDAGCGEGYYDRYIIGKCPSIEIYGLDLASAAVRRAAKSAKKLPNLSYCVSGIFDMPFPDASARAVLSVFAPVPEEEAARVLCDGGVLIVVSPAERHLYGLKKALYENPTENDAKNPAYNGLSFENVSRLSYTMTLSPENASRLFAMTPYFFRSSGEVRDRAANLGTIECEADFYIKVYRKRGTNHA